MDISDITRPALSPAATNFLTRAPHGLLIDGSWQAGSATFATVDPATGETLAQVSEASAADVDRAVAAARTALETGAWPAMMPMDRAKLLWAIADTLEAHIDELAELETLDQGKPLFVGRWAEIPGAIAQFRFFGGLANQIEGKTIPTSVGYAPPGKQVFAYTVKEPVGVVAAIVPWNSPLVLTAMKLAPALAAGCTVVLKPAEDTSLTAIRMLELMIEAGLPAGVVNLVTGLGRDCGAALAAHPLVDKIAFTGSTATGRAIIDAAKSNFKRLTLELGGKSPVIILPDADLDAAIPGAANAIFFNGGQVCVAGSRLYAHASVFDRVVEGVAGAAKSMVLGHGLDATTQMGPLVSKAHAAKVAGFLGDGRKAGASLITGGETAGPNASFITPTVITDVRADMAIVREEVFGPVLVVQRYDDLDTVVAASNDSDYGLAASIWTESLSTAHRLAGRMRAGTVWINTHSMYDASLPIGGMKQSGWGRDSGVGALENYLETKTVCAVV